MSVEGEPDSGIIPSPEELERRFQADTSGEFATLKVGSREYSAAQKFFMWRLAVLQHKRKESIGLDPGDYRIRALNKALYSTYRDCADLGLTNEANHIIFRYRQEAQTGASQRT